MPSRFVVADGHPLHIAGVALSQPPQSDVRNPLDEVNPFTPAPLVQHPVWAVQQATAVWSMKAKSLIARRDIRGSRRAPRLLMGVVLQLVYLDHR